MAKTTTKRTANKKAATTPSNSKTTDFENLIKVGFKFRNAKYEYKVISIDKDKQLVTSEVDCNSGNYQDTMEMKSLLEKLDNGILKPVK